MPPTETLVVKTGATNGHRRPVQVTVDRHELVGHVLDWQALTAEAMDANGTALQILCGLERDAAVYEAMRATHSTNARLMQLLTDLRAAAHELDNPTT